MVRLLLGLSTLGTHFANGFFTDYENTDERPIIAWIKSLDMVRISRSGFLGDYGGTFDLLGGYGCACHAIISGKTASGKPVDALDRACQQYLSCTKCIKRNFDGDCSLQEPYELDFMNFDTSEYSCPSFLTDCSRSVCECDAQLMNAMTELLLANPLMNPWDDNSNFDYDQSKCVKAQNPHKDEEHKCCGEISVPNTFYNSERHDCCKSEEEAIYTIQPKGTCKNTITFTNTSY